MQQALHQAIVAMDHDEVPIGAVIVFEGRILARGHNQRELLQDPTAHAEMLAITAAAEAMGTWRLNGCTMYVTLEPCLMCAGAILLARMDRVVYGAADPKAGACGSLYDCLIDSRLNHRCAVTRGVMADDCGDLLSAFFRAQRARGKK